jgi:hypothetical protein
LFTTVRAVKNNRALPVPFSEVDDDEEVPDVAEFEGEEDRGEREVNIRFQSCPVI